MQKPPQNATYDIVFVFRQWPLLVMGRHLKDASQLGVVLGVRGVADGSHDVR